MKAYSGDHLIINGHSYVPSKRMGFWPVSMWDVSPWSNTVLSQINIKFCFVINFTVQENDWLWYKLATSRGCETYNGMDFK